MVSPNLHLCCLCTLGFLLAELLLEFALRECHKHRQGMDDFFEVFDEEVEARDNKRECWYLLGEHRDHKDLEGLENFDNCRNLDKSC